MSRQLIRTCNILEHPVEVNIPSHEIEDIGTINLLLSQPPPIQRSLRPVHIHGNSPHLQAVFYIRNIPRYLDSEILVEPCKFIILNTQFLVFLYTIPRFKYKIHHFYSPAAQPTRCV